MHEAAKALNGSVLVLNRFFMAVHVITVRRAFTLLYREIAEVVDCEEGRFANYDFNAWCELSEFRQLDDFDHSAADWVRSVTQSIQAPRIIRLTSFDRVPRLTLKFSRRNLFARDGYKCQYCGESKPMTQLSVDHVVPRSRGGGTTWENVVCSCVGCNTKKGGRTPQEARMRLLQRPTKPKHNPLLVDKLRNPKYESWRSFLPEAKNAATA